jgi:general secretion pathway protein C
VGGATIQAIARDRVLLSVNGRTEYLAFPIIPAPGAPAAGAPAPGVASSPIAPSPMAPVPPPNPAALISRLNATPVDGGYRVGEGAPPGLRAGDVIQSVDGTAAGNQAALANVMAAAQARGSVQVQLVRDGKPFTITVPTR